MTEFQPRMTTSSAVNMVVVIVDGGRRDRVLQVCRNAGSPIHYVCMGHGTARTEMLDLLGLGETHKEIVLCLISETRTGALLKALGSELQLRYPGHGIAFSIPIGSIGVRVHKLLKQGDSEEEYMEKAEKAGGWDVVAAILDQGYTNRVMDAARATGARGGTVISARGLGADEVRQFLGIELQAEKEIVLLVVKSEEKQRIMTELMKLVGLRTESHGIVLSLPVSHAIGLAD